MQQHIQSLEDPDLKLGRPDLRQYIIAVETIGRSLPPHYEHALEAARKAYDAGRIELCRARAGDKLLYYAIPRKFVDKGRRPYFSVRRTEQ